MKRLCINPITREIAPKYRGQKAVYIAKKDHNSVLLGFEIPKTVDGHDISTDGNIIHIHYANISEDDTSVSRGMSEAVDVTVDEDVVTFRWRIPNTATRYAGVVSIGVTIERYEDVDGTPQEVYSWSTAPYGGMIVQDSMDNSNEVCERDFDYLVKTCNAIVDLALADKIANVEAEIDTKLSEAETEITTMLTDAQSDIDAKIEEAKGCRDTVVSKAAKAEQYASQTQSNAEKVDSAKKDIDTKHLKVSEWATSAKADADRADGYAEEAYSFTFGNDDFFKDNNAKYFYEQTKKFAQSSIPVGEVTGVGAVKIDDYALLPGAEIKTEVINLIQQEEFFETNHFELNVLAGETYYISCVFKPDTNPSICACKILRKKDSSTASYVVCEFRPSSAYEQITIEEGYKYFWHTEGADAKDVYESVSMFCVGTGLYKSYGKNLFNNSKDQWTSSGSYYVKPLPLIDNLPVTVSGHYYDDAPNGIVYIQKSTDGGNYTNISNLGVLAGTVKKNINITKKSNEQFRLLLDSVTYGKVTAGGFLKGIQVEVGTIDSKAYTKYEEYKEPVDGAYAIIPTTTLVADAAGVKFTAEYKRDINKVIAKLEQAIVNS